MELSQSRSKEQQASLSGPLVMPLQVPLRLAVVAVFLIGADARRQLCAEPRTENAVGLGATTCRQFKDDVRSNPNVRLNYLAWAQGFMSGILLGRPPGVDVGLDLDPPTFGLLKQLQFLEDYCGKNASQNFANGVEALYKRLRQEGKT
jgi:hypothetical protein